MKREITSYEDLLNAKQNLKFEISEQELEIKNNKFLKLSSSLINRNSLKDSFEETLSTVKLKNILSSPLANLTNTFLMTNKATRKYFVAFSIIKETIPFAIKKIKEIINQK